MAWGLERLKPTVRMVALATVAGQGLAFAGAHAADGVTDAAEDHHVDEVLVLGQRAYPGGQLARDARLGALGEQDLMSVPFAVNAYTQEAIRNRQALTIGEVLVDDPAVHTTMGYGNFSEVFVIRGFPLYGDDVGLEGLYGVAPRQLTSTQFFDRVEVLKGANAFLNGAAPGGSAVGGGVNLAFKRADTAPLARVTVDYGSDSQVGGTVDLGRRFGPDGAFGVRLNGSVRSGETAVDNEQRDTRLGSLDLDYRTDKLRVSLDVATQRQEINDGRPVVYVSGASVPKPPSGSENYGQKWSSSLLRDTFGVVRGEYDVLPDMTVYATFGARDTHEDGDYASPTITSATGAGTVGDLTVPRHDNAFSGQAGVRARVDLGWMTHQLNLGGSILAQEGRYAYALARATPINLYTNPYEVRPTPYLIGGNLDNPGVLSKTDLSSIFGSDTMGFFDDRLLVTVGARGQSMRVRGWSYAGVPSADYNQSVATPVAGLVYKLTDTLSLYANRVEALSQGPTAPATAVNAGQVFAPYLSTQYEVGAKADFQTFGGEVALFRIAQPVGLTDAATRVYGLIGQQRNQGVEFSLHGEPLPGLVLRGGATLLDATLTRTAGGANDGNSAVGTPDYQVTMGAEWTLPWYQPLTLTGHLIRSGSQYLDAANTLQIPGWTRVDLGWRYATVLEGRPVTIRGDVLNVAGNDYWESSYGGYLAQGAPRSYRLSFSVDF